MRLLDSMSTIPTTTLTHLRLGRGWSKSELGRRARVDNSRLSKIEGKRLVPYPCELRRLARALHWPARDGAGLLNEFAPERSESSLADDSHQSVVGAGETQAC
jgi:transcriptional regulator with XRE-family HTH domain